MKLSDVLRAEKRQVSQTPWTDEKLRNRDFPMRGRAFPLSRKWRWSRVTFAAAETTFVVLIAYHKELPEFLAVLAERVGNDSRVLCHLEYHGNHPIVGWHMHLICDDFERIAVGVIKPLGQVRVPAVSSRHRRAEFHLSDQGMEDRIATDLALRWFRVPHQGSLAFLDSGI